MRPSSARHGGSTVIIDGKGACSIWVHLRWLCVCLALSANPVAAQRAPIPQQLTFTPYHANGVYDVGEIVGWTVSPGPIPPTYAYKWTVRRNNAVAIKEGKLDLSSGKAAIEVVPKK